MMIHSVILCGGSGTRLWPLSRKAFPKQFVDLFGSKSLFASCASMLSGERFAAPTVVTASDFRFIVTEQLLAEGIDPGPILIEPSARNTAPAILAAALVIARDDPDAVMLVTPSDHEIADADAFRACVKRAEAAATDGKIVTFGVTPTYAETGYGWLELGTETVGDVTALKQFVEKPPVDLAETMLEEGGYLWNAGIFLFKASTIIEAFEMHAAQMARSVRASVEKAQHDLGFLRLDPEAWDEVEEDSIDYAVMEKADNLWVAPYPSSWSDLGGWNSIYRAMDCDPDGVASSGAVTSIDCKNSLLRSEVEGLELVGIGLENLVAIAMNDAVLISERGRSQDVKTAVAALKKKDAKQAVAFNYDHRPWGHFESLAQGERFQVKRIVVHPGAALSLQSHVHRSEHWIVVSGTARVTIENNVTLLTENQSIYIPLGAKHRMENPGKVPMVLIEVQTGTYLGEDDIVRYEDVYARGQGAKG